MSNASGPGRQGQREDQNSPLCKTELRLEKSGTDLPAAPARGRAPVHALNGAYGCRADPVAGSTTWRSKAPPLSTKNTQSAAASHEVSCRYSPPGCIM
jgi:hypothetical protein